MKLKHNRSGFTLLEIIIVVIIVGVLASLALPRFFETINFSRATEALNAMAVVKRAADRCAMMAGSIAGSANFTNCVTFSQLGIENPGTAPGASFNYILLGVFASPNWVIVASRVGDPGSRITFTYDTVAGTVSLSGTGDYSGIQ